MQQGIAIYTIDFNIRILRANVLRGKGIKNSQPEGIILSLLRFPTALDNSSAEHRVAPNTNPIIKARRQPKNPVNSRPYITARRPLPPDNINQRQTKPDSEQHQPKRQTPLNDRIRLSELLIFYRQDMHKILLSRIFPVP